MRVHHFLESSTVNGPGSRFVLWVRGCSVHCIGCTNRDTWDFSGGTEMTTDEIVQLLKEANRSKGIEALTVSGGEPMDQFDALYDLVKTVKKELPSFDILVFTGRYMEYIKDYSILNHLDILVDGPYVAAKQNYNLTWRGSENQRIFLLNDNIRQKMRDVYKMLDTNGNIVEEATGMELFVGKNGEIESTGFGPITDKSLKRLG
jgi:anaerobic ribonucleoside-triphosphate reductase activating protein